LSGRRWLPRERLRVAFGAETGSVGGLHQEYYQLRTYKLRTGPQLALTQGYFEQALIPALNLLGMSPAGAFNLYRAGDPHLLRAYSLDFRRDTALARHPAGEGSGVCQERIGVSRRSRVSTRICTRGTIHPLGFFGLAKTDRSEAGKTHLPAAYL